MRLVWFLDQGLTVAEAGRSLEMLRRWIREHLSDDSGQAFRGDGKLTLEQEKTRSLKTQIRQLKME